ncbi:MAG TPA: hypothetical protein VFL74_03930, partial [Sphingomicrobium sp.]|jgi:hypothetical protein|nr:hypothetical protein [Sphingomicrobium sp.]
MNKLMFSLTAMAALGGGLAALSVEARAQDTGDVKIAEIIVYGDDPCPRSTEDEVVVCARKPEAERYRIPERYRQSGPIQTRQSWAQKAKSFEYVGRTGIQSCSAVGPGGYTGCLQNMIDRAKSEARQENKDSAPPLENTPGY